MGETTLNEYIDRLAIKILRCDKVEDAMNLAEEIVNDTKQGVTRAIRSAAAQTLITYGEIAKLLDSIEKMVPFHKK